MSVFSGAGGSGVSAVCDKAVQGGSGIRGVEELHCIEFRAV